MYPADSVFYRASKTKHRDSMWTPPDNQSAAGGGNGGRFSPLDSRNHLYLAQTRTAAILESALHHASGPEPRIYRHELAGWEVSELVLDQSVRLIDLRDDALHRLGIDRDQITGAGAMHYPCTRAWAAGLVARKVGGQRTHGFAWTSRQGRLHSQAHPGGLIADVLAHRAIDVAVLYQPDSSAVPRLVGEPTLLVQGQEPARLIVELANLIQTPLLW